MNLISTIIFIFGVCAALSNEKSINDSKSAITNILELLIKEIEGIEKIDAIQHDKPDKYQGYAFTWKIDGIEEILTNNDFSIESEEFPVPGYPFKAKAKLTSNDVFTNTSLAFIDKNKEGKKIPFQVIPRVTFTLKSLKGADNDVVRSTDYLFTSIPSFDKFYFERWLARKSWLVNSTYTRNDSIVIDIVIEPPSVAKAIASNDGTLAFAIDNYTLRKQRDVDELEKHHSSPYFYTSPNGFRLKVQMHIDGYNDYKGQGISAQIDFLTGENDSSLTKVFAHKATIILFNQLDSTKHFKKTVEKDIKDKLYYFVDLLPHDEIENDGFLKDDSLYYEVVIEPAN